VVDPLHNALACAQGTARHDAPGAALRARDALCAHALAAGPAALTPAERSALVGDPLALSRLHFAVWTDPAAHAGWVALRERAPTPLPQPWLPAPSAPLAERPAA